MGLRGFRFRSGVWELIQDLIRGLGFMGASGCVSLKHSGCCGL